MSFLFGCPVNEKPSRREAKRRESGRKGRSERDYEDEKPSPSTKKTEEKGD